MDKEELKKAIDIVAGIEVHSEAEAIAKEELMSYVEQLQQENENLRQINKEHQKLNGELRKENNILAEFEKWLEEEMKRKNSRWEQFRNQINTQELVLERLNAQIVFINCCLKRIQELKEGKK